MAFNINSLLNPEGSINQETEVRKILSKAYADCEKTLPKQSPKEGALAYFSNVLIHITEVLYKNFTDELLDEERLNSTGHTIVNQAYRANGFNDMGILEFHTRKRKMLRSMKEAVDANAATLKNIREIKFQIIVFLFGIVIRGDDDGGGNEDAGDDDEDDDDDTTMGDGSVDGARTDLLPQLHVQATLTEAL
ncbi:hypothetical protein CH35J_008125 [Colletotrichum higginsianum]|uniref:Uncharacterized protein n=1 Tax=Colletotrichum higginsianum TaxID=80884 RepID=A0A4T0VRS5_9PEZI|nr:hypothetical protein CH35J_008125 [Colletotrichum higginsianum]